jgi:hypothetical protein
MEHMTHTVSAWDTTWATLLLIYAVVMWTAVGVLAYVKRAAVKPWMFHGAVGVIVLGVLGQIGHFQEHVAQAGYWVTHPNSQPWMTPWATALANGFGKIDMSKPSLGMEILHLTGNFIFLAGLVGITLITRGARPTTTRKWARMGVWMQGIHGLEHLTLTLSVAFGAKQAIGMSTWFGLMEPGPGLWTFRIWWHLIANLIGTVIFAIALFYLWQERAAIRAAYKDFAPVAGAMSTGPRRRSVKRPELSRPSAAFDETVARPSTPVRAKSILSDGISDSTCQPANGHETEPRLDSEQLTTYSP